MRCKVTVVGVCVCLSVCLSVTMKSATYLIYSPRARYLRVLYGVLKVFVVWLLLKTLRSRVMTSFAGHHRFVAPCGELSMFISTKGTTMASFKLEVYSDRSNNTTGSSLILAHRADTDWGFLAEHHRPHTCRPLPQCWHSHFSMLPLPPFYYVCACVLLLYVCTYVLHNKGNCLQCL